MYLVLIEFHELVSQQNCQCTGGSSQRGSGPLSVRCVSKKNLRPLPLPTKFATCPPLTSFQNPPKFEQTRPPTLEIMVKWQGTLVFVKQNVLRLGDIPFFTKPAHA